MTPIGSSKRSSKAKAQVTGLPFYAKGPLFSSVIRPSRNVCPEGVRAAGTLRGMNYRLRKLIDSWGAGLLFVALTALAFYLGTVVL